MLDKYLINQNFIFKKPNFISDDQEEEKDEIVDECQNINNNNNPQQSGEKFNGGLNNNFYAKAGSYRPFNLTANKRFNSGKSSTTQGKIKIHKN